VDLGATLILQTLGAVATIAIFSIGLAVIFGMMRVINFAHDEFIMLGGYTTVMATRQGVNVWVAMLVLAPLVVGLIGAVAERLIVRRFYGQIVTTMLATWGISLTLIGLVTVIFGNTVSGISPPLGSLAVGKYAIGNYELLLVAVAAALFAAGWLVLRHTSLGLIARGTMQDREMSAALGIDHSRVYATTFAVGAAVTGLTGALIAPIVGVVPTIGAMYIAKAFITVISGGVAILAGTLGSSVLLGGVNTMISFVFTPVLGEVALLATAVVLLRLLPQGITGRFFRKAL